MTTLKQQHRADDLREMLETLVEHRQHQQAQERPDQSLGMINPTTWSSPPSPRWQSNIEHASKQSCILKCACSVLGRSALPKPNCGNNCWGKLDRLTGEMWRDDLNFCSVSAIWKSPLYPQDRIKQPLRLNRLAV